MSPALMRDSKCDAVQRTSSVSRVIIPSALLKRAQKTSLLRASDAQIMVRSFARHEPAMLSSDDTGNTRASRPKKKPFKNAMPMRKPVNDPGPVAIAAWEMSDADMPFELRR
jgi:hypothetical protein